MFSLCQRLLSASTSRAALVAPSYSSRLEISIFASLIVNKPTRHTPLGISVLAPSSRLAAPSGSSEGSFVSGLVTSRRGPLGMSSSAPQPRDSAIDAARGVKGIGEGPSTSTRQSDTWGPQRVLSRHVVDWTWCTPSKHGEIVAGVLGESRILVQTLRERLAVS
ncbi:hypothetical protein C8R45DRAFT_1099972 [Mycena sanguinolenta]|nr:hypothetical protein C8R45DRAFT_1099972 [Mycena sanguinolenta]